LGCSSRTHLHVLEAALGHAGLRTIVIDGKPTIVTDNYPASEDQAIGILQPDARLLRDSNQLNHARKPEPATDS